VVLMKRIGLALTLTIVLFSTVVISQTVSLANANPNWKPWESTIEVPTITFTSPIMLDSYPSDNIHLKFTVTTPSDWIPSKGEIRFISYCVDGFADGIEDENETRVEVQDSLGVVNKPSSFNFSFNLAGLKDGEHTVEVFVDGIYEATGFGTSAQRIKFTVYTPFPTTLLIASVSAVAVVAIGLGLFVYFKKHKH
jgi:hypothetical protein